MNGTSFATEDSFCNKSVIHVPLNSKNFKIENGQDDEIVNLSADYHGDLSIIMDSVITYSNCPPRIKELLVDLSFDTEHLIMLYLYYVNC